ncbi:MAG: Acetyl-coenzyme A carboxylase carboxyl transferase subunit alpha [Hyphomicrobiaceae bacterium hypho_1]
MRTYLDFEKPIAELESKVAELKAISNKDSSTVSIIDDIENLQQKAHQALIDVYANLTPWQKTQVARHPERPHCTDFINELMTDFTALAGDRYFAEDTAIIAGIGRFGKRSIVLIGHEKGSDTQGRLKHNFGMARPEGYRKAARLMEMADRFDLPVVTIVDTAGAYPGVGAEERGQAEAIAQSTNRCLLLGVPIISLVVGEGGSGGAVAIAAANQVLMMEHAIYTVASPEAAASILWRDSDRAIDAATNMRITAQDLLEIGVVDSIVPEPIGGAHRDRIKSITAAGEVIETKLAEFSKLRRDEVRQHRHNRFLKIGRSM